MTRAVLSKTCVPDSAAPARAAEPRRRCWRWRDAGAGESREEWGSRRESGVEESGESKTVGKSRGSRKESRESERVGGVGKSRKESGESERLGRVTSGEFPWSDECVGRRRK